MEANNSQIIKEDKKVNKVFNQRKDFQTKIFSLKKGLKKQQGNLEMSSALQSQGLNQLLAEVENTPSLAQFFSVQWGQVAQLHPQGRWGILHAAGRKIFFHHNDFQELGLDPVQLSTLALNFPMLIDLKRGKDAKFLLPVITSVQLQAMHYQSVEADSINYGNLSDNAYKQDFTPTEPMLQQHNSITQPTVNGSQQDLQDSKDNCEIPQDVLEIWNI